MKKILTIFVVLLAFVTLTNCGKSKQATTAESAGIQLNEQVVLQPADSAKIMELKDSIYNVCVASLDEKESLQKQMEMAEGLSELLVRRYDDLFPSKNIAAELKCEELLNRMLEMEFEGETTVDMMKSIGQDVTATWLLSMVKTKRVQDKWKAKAEESGLFQREAEAWIEFSSEFSDVCYYILHMRNFGGSIVQLTIPSAHKNILNLRAKSLDLLLNDSIFEASYEQGVPDAVAAETLMGSMKHYLDEMSDTSFLMDSDLELYLQVMKEARGKLPVVRKALDAWLSVRHELSDLIDHDNFKPYRAQTSNLLIDLAKELDE